jgi:hypothetical protein
VEFALRSKFPRTRGAGRQMEGGWAHGSHNRTMSHAIPKEKFLEEGRVSQCKGKIEDLCPK